jgi:hypothetical protein
MLATSHTEQTGARVGGAQTGLSPATPEGSDVAADENVSALASPEAASEWLTTPRFALLLGLLVLATFPGVLLAGRSFIIRDFGLFSYPVAHFQRESFWHGQLPLWNPYNHCGVPFLAQWNTMSLYPFSVIYLLLPLEWSLSLFCLAHLFWSGMGMYILAHRWTGHRPGAALAGVVFAFNGLALNFLMWPCHIAAYSWVPWVLWLAPAGWREGGKKLVWAALAGAAQMLAGGPETTLITWFMLLLLVARDARHRCRLKAEVCKLNTGKESNFRLSTFNFQLIARFLGMASLVALVCAAQLLPFLQLASHSQRDSSFGAADWPMPIWGWANFLLPLFHTFQTPQGVCFQPGQYWTSSYYAGIGTLWLGAVALRRAPDRRVWWLAALILFGLLLALGDHGLLYRVLRFCCPALGFIRYSIKYVLLFTILAPLLAAFGLKTLDAGNRSLGQFERGSALTILLALVSLLSVGREFAAGHGMIHLVTSNALARAACLSMLFLLLAWWLSARARKVDWNVLPVRRALPSELLGCLLLVAVWVDLVTHVPNQNPTVPAKVFGTDWPKSERTWSPAPRLGETRAMLAGVAEATLRNRQLPDVEQNYVLSRLALLADCNLLEDIPQPYGFFSLVPEETHNVTVLPFMRTNQSYEALLNFMGVAQTTEPGTLRDWTPRPGAMPLVTAGQRVFFVDDAAAYEAFERTNIDFRRIVMLPPEAENVITATQRVTAQVLQTRFEPEKVSIEAEAAAPSMVVIAQSYYPAWHARVDGQHAKLWRANYAFQAVQIPAGKHRIELVYEDKAFHLGLLLSGLGLMICLGIWWRTHFRGQAANISGQSPCGEVWTSG